MAITMTNPTGTQTGAFPIFVQVDDGNILASLDASDFSVTSNPTGATLHILDQAFNASFRRTNIVIAVVPPSNMSGTATLSIAQNAFRVQGSSTTFPSSTQTGAAVSFDTDGTPPFGVNLVRQSVETNGDFEVIFTLTQMVVGVSLDLPSWRDFLYDGASVTGVTITRSYWNEFQLLGTAVQTNLEQTLSISIRSRRLREAIFNANGIQYTGDRIPSTDLAITTLRIPGTGSVPQPTTTTP